MSTTSLDTHRTTTIDSTIAWRLALAANAVAALVGLTIKFAKAVTDPDPRFHTALGKVVNELCYFTIESNLIVLVVCVALAVRPDRALWFAGVPRLTGIVCITVTGVVYHAVLASSQHYVGVAAFGDALAHTVSPILFVGTWIVLGPRGELCRRQVRFMLVFPVAWVIFTLVRGAIIGVYPYDFVNVSMNGYPKVVVTVLVLLVAVVGLGRVAVSLDRRLAVREGGAA